MATAKRFQELEIWKDAQSLAVVVFDFVGQGRFSDDFTAQDQIRKTALSISSYIAEGFSYGNQRDFASNLKYAKAATAQLQNQIILYHRIGYLGDEKFHQIDELIENLLTKLQATISFLMDAQKQN